jgi:hypothetical protein
MQERMSWRRQKCQKPRICETVVRDLGCEISILVLSPNEVSRTRPISMARQDLRFIILGGGDPRHQFGERTAVITYLL